MGNKIYIEFELLENEVFVPIEQKKLLKNNTTDDFEIERKEGRVTVPINITEEHIALYNRYKLSKDRGFVFTLEDDEFNPKIYENPDDLMGYHFQGYSSELYLYLNGLDKDKLLNIIENIKPILVRSYHEVNMRMDGASGMLRSGGKDILIDKIRYLSYLLRLKDKNNDGLLTCRNLKLNDLFKNQDNLTVCKSKDELLKEQAEIEKRNKMIDNMEELQNQKIELINKKLEASNNRIDNYKSIELQKQIDILENKIEKIKQDNEKNELELKSVEYTSLGKTLILPNFNDLFQEVKKNKNFKNT